jgi:hypothetical protein
MAIKALQTAMLTKQIKITYFAAHCGAEIEEPIELRQPAVVGFACLLAAI